MLKMHHDPDIVLKHNTKGWELIKCGANDEYWANQKKKTKWKNAHEVVRIYINDYQLSFTSLQDLLGTYKFDYIVRTYPFYYMIDIDPDSNPNGVALFLLEHS